MRVLDPLAMRDIIHGAGLLGSGGGGSIDGALAVLNQLLPCADTARLIEPGEPIAPDAKAAVIAGIGAPTSAEPQNAPTGANANDAFIAMFETAFNALKTSEGKTLSIASALETGAGNTLAPLILALRQGLPVIDGDGAGRAIPKLTMATYAAADFSATPNALSNLAQEWLTFQVPDTAALEAAVRPALATSLYGGAGAIALWAVPATQMRDTAIAGTFTRAQAVGRVLRECRAADGDPVAAVLKLLNGYLLFRGSVSKIVNSATDGFDLTTVSLSAGEGQPELWVYALNESLIAWRSDRDIPLAMAPDLLCWLTPDGAPLSNADLQLGQEVVLIGVKADAPLRRPPLLRQFMAALRQLGYGGPYRPIEALQSG